MIRIMLARTPSKRLNLDELEKAAFFENDLIKTIRFLEALIQKSQPEKIQYLKSMPSVLSLFSDRLLYRKVSLVHAIDPQIFPLLADNFMDSQLIPFLLPGIFT
jgi:SCY1-like protein 2